MSYAIETKKRKWDRLLESFNERSSPSHPSTAISTDCTPSTVSLIPTFEEEIAKKRRLAAFSSLELSHKTSTTSLTNNYLPSNRNAFLERLETFRSVTKWHIPSTEPINAAEWAKRGWICVDTDTVACGICRERVLVDIDIASEADKENEGQNIASVGEDEDDDQDGFNAAAEVYDGIVKRFMDMIITAHEGACPWRRRGCDSSIQRVEGLLNTHNAIKTLRSRYDGLVSPAVKFPDTQPMDSTCTDGELELSLFFFDDIPNPDINTLRLAICGWQTKGNDVVECRNCFRSLGMWLYRGKQPAMERLDVIESHLEYCPWRSPMAQDSEISTSVRTDAGRETRSKKVAGWYLVCQAITTDNAKRTRARGANGEDLRPTSAFSVGASSIDTTALEASPEQREKRMKALLRRITAAKKPFNVKGLIKKKKDTKV